MALSLDSIYKPVNDFFLNRFKTEEGSPIFFKFDKFGSVISDKDFIDPRTPEAGYSPALAKEKFSDIVNSVPIEDSDGQNIYFSQNNIDHTYHDQWLGPSIPFVTQDADDTTRNSIIDSFNSIKAEALRMWDSIKLESSTGIMFDFKPALATPENWYDSKDPNIWTHHLFQASETVTTPVDNSPKFKLWRLKVDDATLQKVLPVENIESTTPTELHHKVLMFKANFGSTPLPTAAATAGTLFRMGPQVRDLRSNPSEPVTVRDHRVTTLPNVEVRDHRTDTAGPHTSINRLNLAQKISSLDLRKRQVIINHIKENAPTQPVTTTSITISFEFCLVSINRPWFHDSFINNKSWFIPGMAQGQLTVHDTTGGTITALPIGFLAIKNLIIEANWTDQDIAISKDATDFGPFEVTFDSTTNKLTHEGIQIIGWILQKMPDLPPNNPPQ